MFLWASSQNNQIWIFNWDISCQCVAALSASPPPAKLLGKTWCLAPQKASLWHCVPVFTLLLPTLTCHSILRAEYWTFNTSNIRMSNEYHFQLSLSSVHSSSSINVSGYLLWWEAERLLRPRGGGHNLNKQSDQSKTADGQMSFAVFPEVGGYCGQVLDKWRTLDW